MTNNKKILAGALALAGVISAGVYTASAYQGDYTKHGPNYTEERHNKMVKIFESSDYDSWKNQMEKMMKDRGGRGGRILEVINKDNFAKFSEAHKLGMAGDKEGADKIRAELGLRTSDGKGGGHGYGKGQRRGNGEGRENGENRGEKRSGHFEDKNNDVVCDRME
jgi:hypothetical protein